jgi:hypothetical protein
MSQTSSANLSLPKNQIGHRQWTAVDKYKLKGLAEQRVPARKIARVLKRSVAVTTSMASKLGIPLTE